MDLYFLDKALRFLLNSKVNEISGINTFPQDLLADLEDLAAIAERKYEPTITHEDLQA